MKSDRLSPLTPLRNQDFLPPINRWMMIGGIVLMGSVISAIALSAVLPYNVTVRAPATVRPSGGLRLVQSDQEGTVAQIAVEANQPVQQGQIIAQLDTLQLTAQQQQIERRIQQAQVQLVQMETQLRFIDAQIEAEQRSLDRNVSITRVELDVSQRSYEQQQATVQADLAEAEAALMLAESEMRRYQELADSGAVSPLQLEEKQAAVQTANSQLDRARAGLIPGSTAIAIAQERLAQESDRTQVILATLSRERESLIQEQAVLQSQLINEQAELDRLNTNLARTTIRATSDGIIFQLNLQNPGQVIQAGDTIAAIAPQTQGYLFKAAVTTQDINKINLGQNVNLRLDACPFSDYGILSGTITAIAPDATQPGMNTSNPHLGTSLSPNSYFEVTIQPSAQQLQRRDRICPLQAGMNADARIIARQETILTFVLRTVQLLAR